MSEYYAYTATNSEIPLENESFIINNPQYDQVQTVVDSNTGIGFYCYQDGSNIYIKKRLKNGEFSNDVYIKGHSYAESLASISINREGSRISLLYCFNTFGTDVIRDYVDTATMTLVSRDTITVGSSSSRKLGSVHYEDQYGNYYYRAWNQPADYEWYSITENYTVSEQITSFLDFTFTGHSISCFSGAQQPILFCSDNAVNKTFHRLQKIEGIWQFITRTFSSLPDTIASEVVSDGDIVYAEIGNHVVKLDLYNNLVLADYDLSATYNEITSLWVNNTGNLIFSANINNTGQHVILKMNDSFNDCSIYLKNPDDSPIYTRSYSTGLDCEGYFHSINQGV